VPVSPARPDGARRTTSPPAAAAGCARTAAARGPDKGAALQPGETAQHQGPLAHEQAPAPCGGESQAGLASRHRPETHSISIARLAATRQQRLPRLHRGGLSARVAARLRRARGSERDHRRAGARNRRRRGAPSVARPRGPDPSSLVGAGRGAVLLDLLLLVRHALLSRQASERAGRQAAEPA